MLDDEGLTNKRFDYRRGVDLNKSAFNASRNFESGASGRMANAYLSNNIYTRNGKASQSRLASVSFFSGGQAKTRAFEGNVARRLDTAAQPQPFVEPKPKQDKKQEKISQLHVIKGTKQQKGPLQTAALSPMLLTFAKTAAAIVLFVALMAFVRVGLTSATVSAGLNSKEISNNIQNELVKKSALEVEDSALGNSSNIRQKASDFNLVAPGAIETLNLGQDVLAYDENKNVSLVNSLNRVAGSTA